jgi:hypothetical protein
MHTASEESFPVPANLSGDLMIRHQSQFKIPGIINVQGVRLFGNVSVPGRDLAWSFSSPWFPMYRRSKTCRLNLPPTQSGGSKEDESGAYEKTPAITPQIISDRYFPRDHFMIGVQLVGEIPPSGLWCSKSYTTLINDRAQATPLSTFNRQHAMMAGKIKRIVEKRAASAVGNKAQQDQIKAVCDAYMAEIKGTASGPFTFSHIEKRYGYGKFRPMMRSVVAKNGKFRAVDTGKEITKSAIDTEILGMMHPNFPAAVGRRFATELACAPFPWKRGGGGAPKTTR